MAISNYREIPQLLRNHLPFDGNSMSAWLVNGDYAVFSYATQIATVTQGGEKFISDRHYSTTTSRHQNLCRSYL